jgi:uncharacterized protein YjbJ (UPF0337 family)
MDERASTTKNEAADQARRVKDTAVDQAAGMAQEAKAKAFDVVGEARQQLTGEADSQAKRVAEALSGVSRQVHSMKESADPGPVRELTGRAAGALDSFAERLDSGGVQGVMDDLSRFARRRPGAFLVGAALAGFAVARVARNSAGALGGSSNPSPSPAPVSIEAPLPEPNRG